MIAVIAGATGLVGTQLLPLLCDEARYDRVVVIARRAPSSFQHPKLDLRIGPLGTQPVSDPGLRGDHYYSCLGTTIRDAGSQAAFRAVDYELCLWLARVALAHQAQKLMLVSALGADADSRVFYSRVKGEIERDVAALGLREVHILQPSLLDGARKELRPGERLALALMRPLRHLPLALARRYQPISAATVARALMQVALRPGQPGVTHHSSESLARIACQ